MNLMRKSFLTLFLFAVLAPLALADATGVIRGTVTDKTGAAIPDATVEIVQVATNYTRTVTTNGTGSFEAPSLPIGTYRVTVKKASFQSFSEGGIPLQPDGVYVVNAVLEVGGVTQTVEVIAAPIQTDTTTIQLGNEISGQAVNDLPVLDRDWIQLQQTLPGTVASSDRFGDAVSSNGNRTQSNNYLINGGDSNDLPLNSPLDIPSPDAIAEVHVVTNTLNPEFGRSSGAILDAVTKSGTNEFHGSAFEYYRDTFLNARNFFSVTTPPFHQNQFGGTFGGPIVKNKLFGFFSYQGTRSFNGTAESTTVFSADQAGGDWGPGAFAGSTKVSPFPLNSDAAGPCPVGGAQCPAGTAYSTLFSTGAIPTQDFSTISQGLITKFVPLPNSANNQFQFSNNESSSQNQYLGRIDYNLSSKDTLYFYGFHETFPDTTTLPFIGASLPGFGEVDTSATQQYTVSYNHIFSSNIVNEGRFTYNRFNFGAVLPQTVVQPSSLGFTGINPQDPAGAGVPFVGLNGFFSLGFSLDGPQPRLDDTYQLADNVSINRGNHSYKFGIDFRRQSVFNPFFFFNNGNYTFNGVGTFSTGLPGADFELGVPDSYAQSSGGFIHARTWEFYSYVQDQWKIRPNLTLTYGLGYQIDTPLTQLAFNKQGINAFRIGQQSSVFPTAPLGLDFPGDPGVTPSGYQTHYNNFAPRLGFAWSPRNNWSVRAGWGFYYNVSEEELTLQNLQSAPFSIFSSGVGNIGASPAYANPFAAINNSAVSVTNQFPFTPFAAGAPVNFGPFEPLSGSNFIDPRFNVPYNMNYNLTVQHQVNRNVVATVSYVGSEGRRLEAVTALNPFNPALCIAQGPSCTNNPVFLPFDGPGPNGLSTLPVPSSVFANVYEEGTFAASNYNAFQATLESNGWHGINLRAAYSYSHALDNASSFENAGGSVIPQNHRLSYGDSQYDARHRLVVSYVYNIPIPGKFQSNEFEKRLLGGWGFSGINTYQTGFPVQLTESDLNSLQCSSAFTLFGCWDRPNIVAPEKYLDPRTDRTIVINGTPVTGHFAFTPNSFAPEALGTIGDARRDFFHGPGINNYNFSFFKNTTITERLRLQLRIDAFNIFNHASFAAPGQAGTATGGVGNNVDASGQFGQTFATQVAARILQLSGHFYF
ncbi:MAG: carboxypeptidase regulatory-like domain-containing protein [Candidatus Acidiferrales bacterium]